MDSGNMNHMEHKDIAGWENKEREYMQRVRNMLNRLMEESEDPDYDQYLAQMARDLDSGKASPWQVEQEAQRS